MPSIRARCASTAGRCGMHRPGTPGPTASAWCSGAFRRPRAVGGGEHPSGHAAGQRARADRLAGDAPRRRRAAAKPWHRRRSADADGHAAARSCNSLSRWRACCSPARGSSSWTSRPPRSRRPRSQRLFALLRRVREAGRSIVFISHSSTTCWRSASAVTVFRNGRTVAPSGAPPSTNAGSSNA